MAFRRRKFRRRGNFRRRGRRNRSTRGIAKKAWRTARRVRSLIEVKKIDGFAEFFPASTAVIALMNGTAQGTSVTTRVGEQISMKSIQLSIQMSRQNDGAVWNPGAAHIAIVLDKEPNGALPAITDIWDFPSGYPPVNFNDALVHRNWSNRRRFKILKHFVWNMGNPNLFAFTSAGATTQVATYTHNLRRWYMKLRGKKVIYNGSGALIGQVRKNAILLCSWSNRVVGETDIDIDVTSRILFWDA